MEYALPKSTLLSAEPQKRWTNHRQASTKTRLMAFLIDNILFCAFFTALFSVFYLNELSSLDKVYAGTSFGSLKAAFAFLSARPYLLTVIIGSHWLYHALLESSRWQATPGKRALGLRLTSPAGRRLTFLQAATRHFTKLFSILPILAGFWIWAGLFLGKTQLLHDHLTHAIQLLP